MQALSYGEEKIHYRVFFIPTVQSKIAIHVHPNGSVQVDAPTGADLSKVKEAVLKRSRWIADHLERIQEQRKHVLPREYVSGESHFYLGRRFQLKVVRSSQGKSGVKMLSGRFRVFTDDASPDRVKALLWTWYRVHARQYFGRRLEALIRELALPNGSPDWRLRVMRRQWGSCSPRGVLSLNPHLVKAPRECVEYVLLHELCHLREHNHSPRFYRLLTNSMPRWRSVKARLDGMAELLLNE